MFKWTGKGGLRRAAGTGVAQVGRIISPNNKFRSAEVREYHRPAFLPATPQEQGFDNTLGRVDEQA